MIYRTLIILMLAYIVMGCAYLSGIMIYRIAYMLMHPITPLVTGSRLG